MFRKLKTIISMVIIAATLPLSAFAALPNTFNISFTVSTCTHDFTGAPWKHDAAYHWQVCIIDGCTQRGNETAHVAKDSKCIECTTCPQVLPKSCTTPSCLFHAPPTAMVTYKSNIIKDFLNFISFGLFFKNSVSVTINATDNSGTGIASVEWHRAPSKVSDPSTISAWTEGTSFTVESREKFILYVRITDNAGNVAILEAQNGVVVFNNVSPVTVSHDYYKINATTGSEGFNFTLNGNTIAAVYYGSTALTSSQYVVSGGIVEIYATYLETLTPGSYDFTVYFNPMGETYVNADSDPAPTATITIRVIQPVLITPNAGQYKPYGTQDDPPFTFTSNPDINSLLTGGSLERSIGETVGNYTFTLGNLQATAGQFYQLWLYPSNTFQIRCGNHANCSSADGLTHTQCADSNCPSGGWRCVGDHSGCCDHTSWGEWINDGGGKCKRTCNNCPHTETKAHSFANDHCNAACARCNAFQRNNGEHAPRANNCTECENCTANLGTHTPKADNCTECVNCTANLGTHTWLDATCTTPKTCSACQATEGAMLNCCPACGAVDCEKPHVRCNFCNEWDCTKTHIPCPGNPKCDKGYDCTCQQAVSIVDVDASTGSATGIRFAQNPAADIVEISVVLPDMRATEAVAPTVIIYDMTGNVVFACKGTACLVLTWDLRNSAGRFVANGTYLVVAEVKDRNGRTHRYSARLGVKR